MSGGAGTSADHGDQHRRAEELFLALADRPRESWAAELDARCADQPALRREVESLLGFHAKADAFLDPAEIQAQTLVREGLRSKLEHEPELRPGQRLGEYVIDRLIGVGGMGSVYVAQQDRPHRTVALKVIRRGFGGPSLLRRFEAEAELLGRLQHPGIAQIFEAGAAPIDGGSSVQPYIAMELIEGLSLTAYAEARRLDTAARLELLAKVCDAVHHAHQRGIIHRDIKPGNILVDASGQPKVLDFGVARAADADLRVTTMQTSLGQLIGTLPYMSPEQVLGDPRELDTRSDVYALGVLLFQLLTDRLPHDLSSRSLPEAARVIREEPHLRLSSVSRIYRGELDVIVAKAMEKDKLRRYQSAADIAEDLRRYNRHEPILARQDSALYVLRKQLRRHRYVAAAIAMAIIALAAFSIYALIAARREQRLAETADLARAAAVAAKERAEEAKARADELGARLKSELSRAKIELGRIEGSVGRLPLAEQSLWTEYLENPESPEAYWALWELYDRLPCLWTLQVPEPPTAIRVAPDGSAFVIGTQPGSVFVYESATGRLLFRRQQLGSPVQAVAVAPAADAVFAGLRDGSLVRIPMRRVPGALTRRIGNVHSGGVRLLALHASGEIIASGGADGSVSIRDVRTLDERLAWSAHDEELGTLTFISGDEMITSPRHVRAQIGYRFWNGLTGRQTQHIPVATGSYPTHVVETPDPNRLLAGDGDRRAFTIDRKLDEVPRTYQAFRGPIRALQASPDRSRLLIASSDTPLVADFAALETPIELARQRFPIVDAGWSSDRSFVLVSTDGVARSLFTTPRPSVRTFRITPQWTFGLAFSLDGRLLAAAGSDATVHVIETDSLTPILKTSIRERGRARALHFFAPAWEKGGQADSDRRLVVGDSVGVIRVLDPRTGETLKSMQQGRAEVYSLEVHADGRRAAAGYADGRVLIWNLEAERVERELPKQSRRVEGLAFSPDGQTLATAGRERGIALWRVDDGQALTTLETSAMGWGVRFTPDGKQLVVATFSGGIDVLDHRPEARPRTTAGHQRLIPGLAISADGAMLATGSEDATIKVWDTASMSRLLTFDSAAGELITIAFAPGGRWMAATTGGGMVMVVDLHSSRRLIEANRSYQAGLRRATPGQTP